MKKKLYLIFIIMYVLFLTGCPGVDSESTPTPTPGGTPTPDGTLVPSDVPTETPDGTLVPSDAPTETPDGTLVPTDAPTETPDGTLVPTDEPSETAASVTVVPSNDPTPPPSDPPTPSPIPDPTDEPTPEPTMTPGPTPDGFYLTIIVDGNGTTGPSPYVPFFVEDSVSTSISAIPDTGWDFDSWQVISGTGCSFGNASAASTTATLTAGDVTIQANFVLEEYILTIDTNGNGTTDPTSPVTVFYGGGRAVTAIPDTGWSFDSWEITSGTGCTISNTSAPTTMVTLYEGDATIQANFILNK